MAYDEANLERDRKEATKHLLKYCDQSTIEIMVKCFDYMVSEPKYADLDIRGKFRVGELFILVMCIENAYPEEMVKNPENPENRRVYYAMKDIVETLLTLDKVKENRALTNSLRNRQKELSYKI